MLSRLIFFLLLSIIYHLSSIIRADAFTMENQNLRLELPDVLGERTIDNQGQNNISTIIRGFAQKPSQPFSYTVSSLLVDFGIIPPTDPVMRTTNLIVEKGQVLGYRVVAWQDHPLRLVNSKEEINDSTCDLGNCSATQSSSWTNPLVFGLGLRVDNIQGNSANATFKERVNFMPFASSGNSQQRILIMSGQNSTNQKKERNDETSLTYKVNVSATQKKGVYQNVIYYLAIPNF